MAEFRGEIKQEPLTRTYPLKQLVQAKPEEVLHWSETGMQMPCELKDQRFEHSLQAPLTQVLHPASVGAALLEGE
jgi:hypothetical protein